MTTTTITKSEKMYDIECAVPGNGLCIDVNLRFNLIVIEPAYYTDGEKNGYDTEQISHSFRFEPEEAAQFWSWYKGQPEFAIHGERMAKALHFAIRKYQSKYGKVYILPVETKKDAKKK